MSALAEPAVRFRDNPIGIAQTRRRLRRRQAAPTLLVVALLCGCAMLYGALAGEWEGARSTLVALIAAILYLGGSTQVASAVAEDRRSGLLDFHRATPTTPWTDALGYLFGPAAREYVGAFLIVPFAFAATILEGDSAADLAIALFAVLSCGVFYHTFAMHVGLSSDGRRVPQSVGVLVFLLFFGGALASQGRSGLAHLTPGPVLYAHGLLGARGDAFVDFYGVPLPHVVFALFVQAGLGVFFLTSAVRKLRREGAHAFSRPGALAFFGVNAFVWLGPAWSGLAEDPVAGRTIGLVGGIGLAVACVLAMSLVPTYLEHVRCVRRAARAGGRPRWVEDGASAWPLIPAFALVVAATSGFVALAPGQAREGPLVSADTALMVASTLAVIAFSVGAVEYARLKMRRASRSGTFLIGFVTLILPWIVASITLASSLGEDVALYVAALSPVFTAVGSLARWAGSLGGTGLGELGLRHVVVSLGVTTTLAAWLLFRANGLRRAVRWNVYPSEQETATEHGGSGLS